MKRLPKWFRWVLLSGLAAVFLTLVWGAGIEPRLVVLEHEVAEIPRLPAEWEGQRVALIADPQVGMVFSNTDTVARIVARLVKMRPAAVFIAGDFIYHPFEDEPGQARAQFAASEHEKGALDELHQAVALLRPLAAAGIPTYAVLGNHDYGIKSATVQPLPELAARVRQELEKIGIRVLQNEAVQLPAPEGSSNGQSALWLVGFGSHFAGEDDVATGLARLPDAAPRLTLMHHPDTFAQLPPGSSPLAMAGHTQGGQIHFPAKLLRRVLGRVNEERPDLRGWIRNYGKPGNRLYINRGIGFSRYPLRIGSPPEITVFTLRAAKE